MSDVFKWTFATIFHYALITSPMLMAQDTPPVENASAQQPEVRVPDDLKDGASPFGGAGVRDSSSNADLPASNVSAPTVTVDEEQLKIVPENIAHAIDRTFLEFYDREDVPTTYADFSTPDLALHIAMEELTSFQLENPVALKTDDRLSAILMHGQADFEVTADAARITAVDQRTTWQLPSHNLNREFTGLFQIDKRLPEGTPLFKNGELAGITLLGTRFMKDDFPGSYVVPASRIVEVLQQLKIE